MHIMNILLQFLLLARAWHRVRRVGLSQSLRSFKQADESYKKQRVKRLDLHRNLTFLEDKTRHGMPANQSRFAGADAIN